MKSYAYSRTAAGIARLQRERQPTLAAIEPVREERAPEPAPMVDNVVRLVIPRTEAQQIIHDIARKHGITYADILSKHRFRHFVAARYEAIVAVKAAKPMLTLKQIGTIFRKDHSTVVHAFRKMGMA